MFGFGKKVSKVKAEVKELETVAQRLGLRLADYA